MSSYYCCLSDGVWEAGIIYIDRSDHRAFPSLSVACLFLLSQFPFPVYASTVLVRTNAGTSAHPAPVRAASATALHCAHLFRHLQNSHYTPGWNKSEDFGDLQTCSPSSLDFPSAVPFTHPNQAVRSMCDTVVVVKVILILGKVGVQAQEHPSWNIQNLWIILDDSNYHLHTIGKNKSKSLQ